jgi:methylmalonyl-CoA mutase N-terminal domain/subunit
MVEAVKRGFPQREIADAAFRYQREVESGQRKLVGVNAYAEGDRDGGIPILRIDPEFEQKQIERVRAVRARRDEAATARALERLTQAARDERENLVPHLLEAVRADATEGEMVAALQHVFGGYSEAPVF